MVGIGVCNFFGLNVILTMIKQLGAAQVRRGGGGFLHAGVVKAPVCSPRCVGHASCVVVLARAGAALLLTLHPSGPPLPPNPHPAGSDVNSF